MVSHKTNAKCVEAVLLVMTCSRLVLAVCLAEATQSSLTATVAWLIIVVLADILDGVVARRFGGDTVWRRIADATVDRLSIWLVFAVVLVDQRDLWLFYLPLAVRGVVLSVGSVLCFWRRRMVTIGGRWHKAASLSLGCFGIALVSGSSTALWATAVAAWTINWILLFDYLPVQAAILRQKPVVTQGKPTRISIRHLSGLRSLLPGSKAIRL